MEENEEGRLLNVEKISLFSLLLIGLKLTKLPKVCRSMLLSVKTLCSPKSENSVTFYRQSLHH